MAGPLLVGVDFSDPSRLAVDAAARLARDLNASIVLVHAFTPPPPAGDPTGAALDPITEVRMEIALDEAVELSTKWAVGLRDRGHEVETVAREGDPVAVLLDEAKRRDAALIVVGSHGRRGLARFVLGSVAEGVVRRADRPVLVVKEPGLKA